MLNFFGSISSISYQFLVLESPFIQVIFMKKHAKNPLFEGLCYNHKGLELFSKTNFEYSWVSEGQYLIEYVFCATLLVWFFVPPPVSCVRAVITSNVEIFWKVKIFKDSISKKIQLRWAKNVCSRIFLPKNILSY